MSRKLITKIILIFPLKQWLKWKNTKHSNIFFIILFYWKSLKFIDTWPQQSLVYLHLLVARSNKIVLVFSVPYWMSGDTAPLFMVQNTLPFSWCHSISTHVGKYGDSASQDKKWQLVELWHDTPRYKHHMPLAGGREMHVYIFNRIQDCILQRWIIRRGLLFKKRGVNCGEHSLR